LGVMTFPGFPMGTITVSLLSAKLTAGPVVRPLSTSFLGLVVSADRKTSAGAPCSILVSRAADESVEMVSVTPGLAASYTFLTSASAPDRDAAPKIVMSTAAVDGAAADAAALADAPPPLEHAARRRIRPTRSGVSLVLMSGTP